MKFGVREICDIVLRAKNAMKIGNKVFYKNEPVLYFDSLKTSSMESQATTVYAQGGRGNARLIAWEGERTVTFTMEDALLSPEGFSILTGAGLIKTGDKSIIIHKTEITNKVNIENGYVEIKLSETPYIEAGTIEIVPISIYKKVPEDAIYNSNIDYYTQTGQINIIEGDFYTGPFSKINITSDDFDSRKANLYILVKQAGNYQRANDNTDFIYVTLLDSQGEVYSEPYIASETALNNNVIYIYAEETDDNYINNTQESDVSITRKNDISKFTDGCSVLVDYYIKKDKGAFEINITPDKFGGNFYLEASTLFRDTNGTDMPAEFIIPNCKIQSNFTFTMASSGDPSTFTFTMDAFPDYTRWNKTEKVFASIQVIEQGNVLKGLERLGTPHNYKSNEDYNPFLTFVREQEKYLLNSNEEPEVFNNAIFSSVDENGNIYNNGLGYKKKTWINSQTGKASDADPLLSEYTVTGFIPYNDNQIISIAGFKTPGGPSNQGISFYDRDKQFLVYQNVGGNTNSLEYSKEDLNNLTFPEEKNSSDIFYIRGSFYNSKLSELEIVIKNNSNAL